MKTQSRSDWALIPNWLSAGRIVAAGAIPLVFLVFPTAKAETIALALFVGASLTDFFDGWLARKLNQTSALGAKLDSLADKALLFATLGTLALTRFAGEIWFWAAALIIVAREVGVTWLRMRYGRAGALSVSMAAKWKTMFQMASAAALLGLGPVERWRPDAGEPMFWLGAGLLAVAVWLSVSSGIGYLRGALDARRG